jgi:hypothetical protein
MGRVAREASRQVRSQEVDVVRQHAGRRDHQGGLGRCPVRIRDGDRHAEPEQVGAGRERYRRQREERQNRDGRGLGDVADGARQDRWIPPDRIRRVCWVRSPRPSGPKVPARVGDRPMCRDAPRPTTSGRRSARGPGSEARAAPDSADSGDPCASARTGGRSSHAPSRSDGSGGTGRTDPVAARRVEGAPARSSGRGGEGGIRTHEVFRLSAFQERRHQPLGHLSAAQDIARSAAWSRCAARGQASAMLSRPR